jgi:hypothetical protein
MELAGNWGRGTGEDKKPIEALPEQQRLPLLWRQRIVTGLLYQPRALRRGTVPAEFLRLQLELPPDLGCEHRKDESTCTPSIQRVSTPAASSLLGIGVGDHLFSESAKEARMSPMGPLYAM